MAVPKKKISYSRTRKRLLSKQIPLSLYTKCSTCSNFIKLHRFCSLCSHEKASGKKALNITKTNINKLYEINV